MVNYSILSKNKKPRISAVEFMLHYQISEEEIKLEKLQEFLDFFELSHDNLQMKSKTEVFFALQGFCLDREAEKRKGQDAILPAPLKTAAFRYFSRSGWVEGEIDFEKLSLTYGEKVVSISSADREILFQALNDLGIMSEHLFKAGAEPDAGKAEVTYDDGSRALLSDRLSSHEILFQIIEAIVE